MLNIEKVSNANPKPRYQKPRTRVILLNMNENLLVGSGDPTITNPDMEWGTREFEEPDKEVKDIWQLGW